MIPEAKFKVVKLLRNESGEITGASELLVPPMNWFDGIRVVREKAQPDDFKLKPMSIKT